MTAARSQRRWALLILLAHGVFLVFASQRLTVFDDEASVIALAGRDARQTIDLFLSGQGQHEHPPAYDLLLHAWIPFAGGEPALLRLPTILFFCAALWLVGSTAELLWGRRLLAVALGVAWPLGYFFGTPAYWSGLAMLGVAGSTWSYFAWRRSSSARHVAAFLLFGLVLVYTNYLGWAFLGGLGIHLLASRPSARALFTGVAAGFVILASYVPLLATFFRQLGSGTRIGRPPFLVAADAGYLTYAMLVSESVAPWHWPAAFALVGIAALAYVAFRTPRMLWLLGLLALIFSSAVFIGVVHNRRISLFGPWLMLYLTGLLACTTLRRTAAVAVFLVFGTGWAGILSERWYGTFRHIEPWEAVASTALELVGPGDLIIGSHPSFFYYVARQLGWEDWHLPRPIAIEQRSQRVFSSLATWEQAIAGSPRLLYVRSAVNVSAMAEEQRLTEFLEKNHRLTFERRYLEDSASAFKNRFFPNQPRWRIELRRYERVEPPESPASPSNARNASSSRTSTPSSRALTSLLPGSAPETR
jgi:hypothetical protein